MAARLPEKPTKNRRYRFDFNHITIVFVFIILVQVILSFIHKSFLVGSLEDYRASVHRDFSHQLSQQVEFNLRSLILEYQLLISNPITDTTVFSRLFEEVLSVEQSLTQVKGLTLFLKNETLILPIDSGADFIHLLEGRMNVISPDDRFSGFLSNRTGLTSFSFLDTLTQLMVFSKDDNVELISLLSLKDLNQPLFLFATISPNLSLITNEIIANYDETNIIFLSFILLGLLAMYYIATYTAVERDEAEEAFLSEHERYIMEQVVHEKESLFTKRIYHTHHKAEKVMGFIKEDLRSLGNGNDEEIKERVIKYSNFISRVIYDMKWYDPPIQTIRNPIFNTDINKLIRFIIDNIFKRISTQNKMYDFQLDLDPDFPLIPINEFVIWEIIEPIIQNSIDHGSEYDLMITIQTTYNRSSGLGQLSISDNGKGIDMDLLEKTESGIKRIFLDSVSTKKADGKNSGYGCFIAYHLATAGCGWTIDVANLDPAGCKFTLEMKV